MARKQLLMIAGGVVAIIVIIFVVGTMLKKPSCTPAALEIWGVYDDPATFSELIKTYEKQNKCASIKYVKKDFNTYGTDLVNAFASDKAPDIFMIHNTWLPIHKDKIKELPETLMTFQNFQDTFVEVAEKDLTEDNKIYGLPLYVDTLALYYNKDYFNTAGISFPPKTWSQLIDDLEKLIKRNQSGAIDRAGISLGTSENINRSTDILALLMLQNKTKMVSDDKKFANFNKVILLEQGTYYPGQDALRFYTDFSNPSKRTYTWNRQMSYSIDAFVEGKTAMMINYSHHIATIKAKTPYLNFAISTMPQLDQRDYDINYANYWAITVSKKTKSPDEAWKFLIYLTNKENSQKYLEKTKKPVARRDLVDWQEKDLQLGVFAKQSLTARSWYQVDSGKIETIFSQAIDSVVLGTSSVGAAIDTANAQVNLLMKKD
jgi:multiple sugar transport system substrate-binding protein